MMKMVSFLPLESRFNISRSVRQNSGSLKTRKEELSS
jgi:hypothetical protein